MKGSRIYNIFNYNVLGHLIYTPKVYWHSEHHGLQQIDDDTGLDDMVVLSSICIQTTYCLQFSQGGLEKLKLHDVSCYKHSQN